jgi:hypothetical protein
MTPKEIHNIWLHMSGKAEGLLEAGGDADLPVMFANAILEYNKRTWVGLTNEEKAEIQSLKWWDWEDAFDLDGYTRAIEAKLKEKNT